MFIMQLRKNWTASHVGRVDHFHEEGESDFIKTWKDFEIPKKWSRLPNPISHNASFMMSDYLRLAMKCLYITPFFECQAKDYVNQP